jgi:hypothetical protein
VQRELGELGAECQANCLVGLAHETEDTRGGAEIAHRLKVEDEHTVRHPDWLFKR